MRANDKQVKIWGSQTTLDELEDTTILTREDASSLIRRWVSKYRVHMIEKEKTKPRIKPWGWLIQKEEDEYQKLMDSLV